MHPITHDSIRIILFDRLIVLTRRLPDVVHFHALFRYHIPHGHTESLPVHDAQRVAQHAHHRQQIALVHSVTDCNTDTRSSVSSWEQLGQGSRVQTLVHNTSMDNTSAGSHLGSETFRKG